MPIRYYAIQSVLRVRIRFASSETYNFMYRSLNIEQFCKIKQQQKNYSYRVAAILKNGCHFESNEISDCHTHVFLKAYYRIPLSEILAGTCFLQKVPPGLYICTFAAALWSLSKYELHHTLNKMWTSLLLNEYSKYKPDGK